MTAPRPSHSARGELRTTRARYFARLLAHRAAWELWPDLYVDCAGDMESWEEYTTQRDGDLDGDEAAARGATTLGEAVALFPGIVRLRLLPAYLGALRDDPERDADLAALAIRARREGRLSPDGWANCQYDWTKAGSSRFAGVARALAFPEDGLGSSLPQMLAVPGAEWNTPSVEDTLAFLALRVGLVEPWLPMLLCDLTAHAMRELFRRFDELSPAEQERYPRWILDRFGWWSVVRDSIARGVVVGPTYSQAVRLAVWALDRLPERDRSSALRRLASQVSRTTRDDDFAFEVRDGGDSMRTLRWRIEEWEAKRHEPFYPLNGRPRIDPEKVAGVFARLETVPRDEGEMQHWYDCNVLAPTGRRAIVLLRSLSRRAGEPVLRFIETVRTSLGEHASRAAWADVLARDAAMDAPRAVGARWLRSVDAWLASARAFERAREDEETNRADSLAQRTHEAGGLTALVGVAGLCVDLAMATGRALPDP